MPIGANKSDVGAGSLRFKLAFDKRVEIDDGYGNTTGDFAEQFRCAGAMETLKGYEAVMASRLEGKQPFELTVRCNSNTAAVTTDWRVRDVKTGVAYAITTHAIRPRRDYVDMLIMAGIADTQVV